MNDFASTPRSAGRRLGIVGTRLGTLALLAIGIGSGCDAGPSAPGPEGTRVSTTAVAGAAAPVRGYVMARWADEIPQQAPGDCPAGLNTTEPEVFPEQWATYMVERRRVRDEEGRHLEWDHPLLPPDACQDPLAQPDPGFHTLDGSARVAGLDLDGVDSRRREGGSCAHDDFTSPDGEPGIDHQLWRLMGCIRGWRPNDLIDRLQRSNARIKEGGYAILLEISGMDDPRNDDAIEVQILSAAEPVTTDAAGGILEHVSLTAHPDPTYHSARARGRIEDGVLTTEPFDLRVKVKQQTQDNAAWFRDARIRATVHADGRIEGLVGGYQDLDNYWSMLTDHWIGERHQGRNAAFNVGYMCAGVYHAMYRVADGHPDPETGACTSISTAIRFEAVPAFVIRPQLAAAP